MIIFDSSSNPLAKWKPTPKPKEDLIGGLHINGIPIDKFKRQFHQKAKPPQHIPPLLKDKTFHPVINNVSSDRIYCKQLLPTASIPSRATPGSVGYDITSAVDTIIQPNNRRAISTSIALQISKTILAQIFLNDFYQPRSGMVK